MNKLLDEALRYASKGWYVFPCREEYGGEWTDSRGRTRELRTKSPYVGAGFHEATLDSELICKWWNKWPNAGIGVSCGHSGLIVIDIDVKDGGVGYTSFMKMNVPTTGALIALTPSGGQHVIFRGEAYSSANKDIGIDIRSKGAYILAPPSTITYSDGSSGSYVKVDGDWDNLNPAPAPLSLMGKLDSIRGKKKKKEDYEDYPEVSHEELLASATRAIWKLDDSYAYDYFKWLRIGMCLYELGDDGFNLWVEWSKSCPEKFTSVADCRYKWETFDNIREIKIWSLFYYAYGKKEEMF